MGGTTYVREDDGTWRYADNWIEVPGARDRTLSERFQSKLVISGSADNPEVERVVVDGADVSSDPDLLGWCLEEGTPVIGEGKELIEVLVPYSAWQEHDRIPQAIVAPEHSRDPAERDVAIAEREYREAERALDQAAAKRAASLRLYDGALTREQARAITGLSVGRIQQLIRSDAGLHGIDYKILDIVERGLAFTTGELGSQLEQRWGLGFERETLKHRMEGLKSRDLVETTSEGYRLTASGQGALAAARARES